MSVSIFNNSLLMFFVVANFIENTPSLFEKTIKLLFITPKI